MLRAMLHHRASHGNQAYALARAPAGECVSFGPVLVDVEARRVTRDGRRVELSPTSLELLLALVDRRGVVASRAELLRDVWGDRLPLRSRTVDTHIAELRRALEVDRATPRYILTARRAGYWLAVDRRFHRPAHR